MFPALFKMIITEQARASINKEQEMKIDLIQIGPGVKSFKNSPIEILIFLTEKGKT
jgi:hypothetical protein